MKMHAIYLVVWAYMRITVALLYLKTRAGKLLQRLVKTILLAFYKTMGEFRNPRVCLILSKFRLTKRVRLLTVGRTVDEAAILYSFLENACHSQLLAEAAAANGVPKRIISDEVAQYTADVAQNPVSNKKFSIPTNTLIIYSIIFTLSSNLSLS